jgi:hypothetical protein
MSAATASHNRDVHLSETFDLTFIERDFKLLLPDRAAIRSLGTNP